MAEMHWKQFIFKFFVEYFGNETIIEYDDSYI